MKADFDAIAHLSPKQTALKQMAVILTAKKAS
jgi:hypothetical protein